MNSRKIEQYSEYLHRLYNTPVGLWGAKGLTFQITENCNLACSYCYQINKSTKVMPFKTAKLLIDKLLNNDETLSFYLNPNDSLGIVLEFIGGEPFLEVELIDKICDYFYNTALDLCHPWATKFRISISTNGTLYFQPNVQKFLKKWQQFLSLSISIDGNKELHDSCRRFKESELPTYDIVEAAVKDCLKTMPWLNSKITLAPENINYFYDAFVNMVQLGYQDIWANCVYEDVWHKEDATILYYQAKKIADYILENHLEEQITIPFFSDTIGIPIADEDNNNYCGGTGLMLAMDPDGNLYPCLRYMPSSLGTDIEPIIIGHVDTGIGTKPREQQWLNCLQCVTRKSQSSEKCLSCPIATGCGWCSAYNYQKCGTINKRVESICDMHKARVLSSVYFYNKYATLHNITQKMPFLIPEEWALEIIPKEEYNYLKELSC